MPKTWTKAELRQLLKRKYGFDQFRPGQLPVIQDLLAGQDVLAVLPTGTGKSLIYQFVGTVLPGIVVVVSPLISLMQDQVARLNYQGEKAVAALTSQVDYGARLRLLGQLNRLKFLFVSPEMLGQPAVLSALRATPISLLVIDEAHCISTWGPDFRPDYRDLGHLRHQLGDPRTLMLTATATEQVQHDIVSLLAVPTAHRVIYSVDRPNIYLSVAQLESEAAKRECLRQLLTTVTGPSIVYFSSKRQTELITDWLQTETTLRVAAYHAGLTAEDRYKVQQQFMAGDLDVICATSAFGMGINKGDIRMVIHYHLPTTLADYVQEIGRAGRDGQQAVAVILYVPGDENLVRNLNALTAATPSEIEQSYQRYQAQPNRTVDSEMERVLTAYWQRGATVAAVTTQFANRQLAKERELQSLLQYVTTKDCRRALLLAHFKEQAPQHTASCCQLPGEPLPVKALGLDRAQDVKLAPPSGWEPTLAKLFLPNS